MRTLKLICIILGLTSAMDISTFAQGTAFNYQGHLNDGGAPANGSYDMTFMLFPTNSGGVAIAGPVTNAATVVSNGLFTIALDFGTGVFNGSMLWLEIGVQTNNGSGFTPLAPRQPILPVPYAITANNASNLLGLVPAAQLSGTIPAGQISGTISQMQLPATLVTNNQSGVNLNGTFSGAFSGNGSALANLNYNAITNPPAIPSTANLVATNDNRTLAFTNPANVINGAFTGNGSMLTNLMNGLLGSASMVYMNFDSVNTSTGRVDATGYLASFGITLTNVNPANSVFIVSSTQDGCASSASSPNRITQQVGGSSFVSYSFAFNTPLQSVTFTRCAVSGGCASPGWTVTAYAGAVALTNVGPGVNCLNCDLGQPAHTYTLNGPGITSIAISANGQNFSAYSSPPLDDFYLIPQPTLNISGSVVASNLIGNGSGLTSLNAAQLIGVVPLAQLPANLVTNGQAGVTLNGLFAGSGAGLTNVPLTALQPGGATNAQLLTWNGNAWAPSNAPAAGSGIPANYPGIVTLTNSSNNFVGTFVGNGVALTNLNASQLSSGTISIAQLPGIVLTNGTSGVNISGTFSGNGAGLTNLNASQLSGTINATQLSGTIAASQLPGAVVTNTETAVTLSGTFNGSLNLPANFGNTALGYQTLLNNPGSQNTAIGYQALENYTSGTENTAVGAETLSYYGSTGSSYNTAIGAWALYYDFNGSGNTAVGANALWGSSFGSDNTAVGVLALGNCNSGNNNIALGYYAGYAFTGSESDDIDIGNNGSAGENGIIRIGTPGTHTAAFIAGTINGNGSGLTNLNASQLNSGLVSLSLLPTTVITNTETGVTLNGTFSGNGSGLTGLPTAPTIANYVDSYSTVTNAVIAASTFQNITNQVDAQINGWTHVGGTASYTCGQNGLYLIEYTAIATVTSSTATTISLHAVENGTEIADSQCTAVANTANQTVPISKNFIANFNSGDVLQFQFAGSGTIGRLVSNYGLGTTRPSFSCTIVRIQ